MVDGVIIDQVARLEIVGAVEEERRSFQQGCNVCGNEIFNLRFNHNLRVEGGNLTGGGNGLGK